MFEKKVELIIIIQKPSREQCTFWYDRLVPEGGGHPQPMQYNPFRGLHLICATPASHIPSPTHQPDERGSLQTQGYES